MRLKRSQEAAASQAERQFPEYDRKADAKAKLQNGNIEKEEKRRPLLHSLLVDKALKNEEDL